ncbi:MAG: DNA-3-methyladenine glycosylase [Bacteroidetes bacterium]|nr:MAG: DNA-3-methyladenine glycosylase [Bacteroidota bacterium]
MENLPVNFYEDVDVVQTARQLLGHILVTHIEGARCTARIVETEAYNGVADRASHAYGGLHTARTAIMYAQGGVAYVYFCYGLHHMLNVVCGPVGQPLAVLIRAVEPLVGMETMCLRRGKHAPHRSLTRGPGSVAKAMGIHTKLHNGLSLQGPQICIISDGFRYPQESIVAAPRIGVGYAGEDALLPYRFFVAGHANLSAVLGQRAKT